MSGNHAVAKRVAQLTEQKIADVGMELVDVEYVKEGSNWYLRLYIDKPGGVTIDDCQLVSEAVSDLIDEADPISGAYIFEVSSPGLDRPFQTDRDYQRHMGDLVEISLYAPWQGSKKWEGFLQDKQGDLVVIETEQGQRLEWNLKDVAVVRQAIRF